MNFHHNFRKTMPYKQSKEYLQKASKYTGSSLDDQPNRQNLYLEYVLNNTPKGQPETILNKIDEFCSKNWMMNIGDEKGAILKDVLKKYQPKSILELGCYCGYSSLMMAHNSQAAVHTIDPNEYFTSVAKKTHEHANLAHRIHIHVGTVSTQAGFLKDHGPFDLIFIDHIKGLYLSDFKLLESFGVIKKGTVVVGDNIIYPGSPEYLDHFKKNDKFDSTLYFSHLEYCDREDAVLVSEKITE